MEGRLISFIAIFLIISLEMMEGAEGKPQPGPQPQPGPKRFTVSPERKYSSFIDPTERH